MVGQPILHTHVLSRELHTHCKVQKALVGYGGYTRSTERTVSEEESEELKWSHYSQADKLLTSSRLGQEEAVLVLSSRA